MKQKDIQPEIRHTESRKLAGKQMDMSLADNKTSLLWSSFMPLRRLINNSLSNNVISLQIYPEDFNFEIDTIFRKWAVTEVSDFENIPPIFDTFTLPEGLYAVFSYKGLNTDNRIFRYIFSDWLPKSDYKADNSRPHFEVLGDKYKNNDPDSEEEIWIPIKLKTTLNT